MIFFLKARASDNTEIFNRVIKEEKWKFSWQSKILRMYKSKDDMIDWCHQFGDQRKLFGIFEDWKITVEVMSIG